MKCRVDECNKITQSKMGYCKQHSKEREILIKKIEEYCKTRGYPKKNFEYYSFAGLQQTLYSASKWVAGEAKW
jgi:hypothetical protein